MSRICLGKKGLGHIANPFTWFFKPPHSYMFSKAMYVREHRQLEGIWLVVHFLEHIQEGQHESVSLIDVKRGRYAFIGDANDVAKVVDIADPVDNAEWEYLADQKNDM